MTLDSTFPLPARLQTPTTSVPGQSRRRLVRTPADRLARQVQGIDAWVTARRQRERTLLAPGLSRNQRLDVAYEVEALRRTHETMKGCCARGLDAEAGPLDWPVPTAVIAHRHAWLVDKLAVRLGELGVVVLLCTDNGAEALGVVVAEQPDIVLVGDRLAMLSAEVLLAEIRLFAPGTLLAVATGDAEHTGPWRTRADAVFLRQQPPSDVADALRSLCSSAG